MITENYLVEHKDHIFVFGDNHHRKGTAGGASLRHLPNTYGFITKRFPSNEERAFFTQTDYIHIFLTELQKLAASIYMNPERIYLISKVGSGLANKHQIYETIIEPGLKILKIFSNVRFV